MRTHIEFPYEAFPPNESEEEEINPGMYGKRLADFLADGLKDHEFHVTSVSPKDWGWMIELENKEFPLWVGCGNYEEYTKGFLYFIEPSKPAIRKWFKNINTTDTIERLASAIESILEQSDKVSNMRCGLKRRAASKNSSLSHRRCGTD